MALTPQPIAHPITKSAIYLVYTVEPGAEEHVYEQLPELLGLARSVGSRDVDTPLTCVVGIGATLWDRLFAAPRPPGLHEFVALHGDRHHAPSTPGDLFVHLRSDEMGLCFELATQITRALGPRCTLVDETHGFRYFDMRAIVGFVDGTENPVGNRLLDTVYAADPEGSSYAIIQKYLHDLDAWNELTIEAQQVAIGRTKLDNIELPDRAPNSHVAVNVIEDDEGNELKIFRLNMPFGNAGAGEFGTYFIGYAADPAITERMLRRMFIGEPVGVTDRLLDFSTALTGCLFFIPPVEFFDDLPPAR